MGAEKERIRVIELGGADVRGGAQPLRRERDALLRARATASGCSRWSRRAFGDLAPFNLLVRSVFADARFVALEQQVQPDLLAQNGEQRQRLDFLERAHQKTQAAIIVEDVAPLEC